MVLEREYYVQLSQIGKENKITNKSLLGIFEDIGGVHSNIAGYGIPTMDKTHLTWVLLDWKVQIIRRPVYAEKILVRTWCRHSLKFYALITWIKDLCYECIEPSKINYDNVSTKIVQFGLDQGKWCLTDSKGQITSRLKQLITIFCSPVPSPITPLGYCCIACAVLSSDSSSLDKILSFFAELNSNRLGDAECIDFLNSLADKLQNIDDVFSELSKLEANEGIIVYENQGYNPTTGKVLTIEKREYNLPREKIHFSSLGYGDDQIAKHQEHDSNIYKWSHTCPNNFQNGVIF